MPQCAAFWSHCLNCLEQELPAQQFKTWILPLRAEELGGEDVAGLRLVAPSNFHRQWLRDRYLRRIEELGEEFFGGTPNIEVGLAPAGGARRPAAPSGSATATPPAASAAAPAQVAPAVVRPAAPEAPVSAEAANYDKSRLNPDFTFDTLVTGRANDLARAAALQVAQQMRLALATFTYGDEMLPAVVPDRQYIIAPDENVHLADTKTFLRQFQQMHDDEQRIAIILDFGALVFAGHVFQNQSMQSVFTQQQLQIGQAGFATDVEPMWRAGFGNRLCSRQIGHNFRITC